MTKDAHEAQTRYFEHLAQRAHEANRIICLIIGEEVQPVWEEAPEWQRDSVIDGVRHLYNNPDASPRDSHDNWMKHKAENGWSYGPVKDPQKKQHPCMRPYDDLPASQQMKDYMFRLCVLGRIPELPSKRDTSFYKASPQLVNAMEGMYRDVAKHMQHKEILAEVDKVRNHQWFEKVY